MEDLKSFFKNIYQNFNDRKIELVIDNMTDDVQWANGMDGGYVYGHDEVRQYWIRQFGLINSNVTPVQIDDENGVAKIKVHQVVHDLKGNLLADEIVTHFFYLRNEKIARFDIGDKR
ncbi:MAG: hypothetical protein ABJA71_09765 [Ginsengibacter sp.]